VKEFKTPVAIIIGSIIIALSIIYYANNDPLSKCMKTVMELEGQSPTWAASYCSGKE
jgi:hypothetical protein